MEINISSKLLENLIGKVDRFGLAKLIKTGKILEGKVLSVKGDTLIVNFGKVPVLAKTQVRLQEGDYIRAVIKDVKNNTLILKLIDREKEVIEKDLEKEIIKNFPTTDKEIVKTAKSFIKQNIPINKKNITELKFIIDKEDELKKSLEELHSIKDDKTKTEIKDKIKATLRDLSQGYLIEKKDSYELIFIFPYINDKKELLFQKLMVRYRKNKKQGDKEEEKVEFSLNLSKLGPVKIDMNFRKNMVDTKFATTKEEVNNFIASHIEDLKEGFDRIKLILSNVHFSILKKEKIKEIDKIEGKIIKGIDIKI